MSSTSVYGENIQAQLRVASAQLTAFPVNTNSKMFVLVVPASLGSIRVVGVSWVASAVLSDADGTMLVDVDAFDVSEGAMDALVDAKSVEAGTANTPAAFTLETEGTEKEFTLDVGDAILVTFTNNSAAIDTNGAITVNVFYHPIPLETAGDDIRHASFYR